MVSIAKRYGKVQLNRNLFIAAFTIVPLMMLLLFTYYPALKLFQLSFSNWNGFSPNFDYVGISNYKDVFSDSSYFLTLKNTLAYAIMGLAQIILALYLAVVLDTRFMARNFFRSVIFMPYILNGVAIAFLFNYLYNTNDGPVNVVLKLMGLEGITFLGNNYGINFSLAFIILWRYAGFYMVIFLSGLQSIQREIYESASIDGANFFHKIRYITIPGIKRTIELSFFLVINGVLQVYFEPFIITKGGPAGMSETFVTKIYQIAYDSNNFGKAAAMSVVLFLITMVIIGFQRHMMKAGDSNE